ncbi:MAG: DUF4097 family beta strand repeat protein [Candidatus Bathyarchaeota archaeon]|nr:MAG: DUF4097 family beta strand repeat protein [Candidatus Bathyarchaeota archaeon]
MARTKGLGFGGFLIGIGLGWLFFTNMTVSADLIAWIMILAGGAIVASSLLSRMNPGLPLTGAITWFTLGLIIALLVVSGPSQIITGGFDSGIYPVTMGGTMNFSGQATAQDILFEVENVNGGLEVETWSRDEYDLNITVKARGTSQSDAESAFEKVDVTLDESTVGGRLELVLTVNVPRLTWRRVTVSMVLTLPSDAIIDLDVTTVNGGLSAAQLSGGDIRLTTTNGDIVLDHVNANSVRGSTTNGRVTGTVGVEEMTASTVNGAIDLTIPPTRDGSYDLGATNGNVDVELDRIPDVGYSLIGRTTNGRVTFDVSGLDYDVDTSRHKEAETSGYSTKAIQIQIKASTTNGAVYIGS